MENKWKWKATQLMAWRGHKTVVNLGSVRLSHHSLRLDAYNNIEMLLQDRFPMQPYELQVDFAQTLINALNNKVKLCFMESPTGTGKSYSLLVGLCTWLEQHRFLVDEDAKSSKTPSWIKSSATASKLDAAKKQSDKQSQMLEKIKSVTDFKKTPKTMVQEVEEESDRQLEDEEVGDCRKRKTLQIEEKSYNRPKIIFTSRTHSQLQQIVESFRKIKTDLICASLASKKHMCINPAAKKSLDVDTACNKLFQKSKCTYYCTQRFKQFLNLSVSESVKTGQRHSICPYYSSKSMFELADVICVPYSSLLKKDIRDKLNICASNCIIVFDEGHNIVEYDTNSLSVQLKYSDLATLSSRLDTYIEKYGNKMKAGNRYLLSRLKQLILCLQAAIKKNKKDEKYTKQNTVDFLIDLEVIQFSIGKIQSYVEQSNLSNKLQSPHILRQFLQFMSLIHTENSFVIYKHAVNINDVSVRLMIMEPKCLKQLIQEARMCVFAGGTLHPLSELEQLKNLLPSVQRQYQHVIPYENCRVSIVQQYRQQNLVYDYRNRENKLHLEALKFIIERVHQIQSRGIIVFVQNYKYLDVVKEFLGQSAISDICIFDNKNDSNIFEKYQKSIKTKSTILFSVMGGRLSEGINFSDDLARALIIFGLPYADITSPELIEKKAYYEQLGIHGYYENLCMRIVNQTVGRAIRHQKDWANIYLVDSRFKSDKLSKWLRNRCTITCFAESIR